MYKLHYSVVIITDKVPLVKMYLTKYLEKPVIESKINVLFSTKSLT